MPILSIIATVLIFIAVFYCTDKHLKTRTIWIKNPKLRLNYSFHEWQLADYSALVIILGVGLLLLTALLKSMGGAIPRAVFITEFFIICVSTIIFSISYYNLTKKYKQYSSLLKIAATLTTLIIAVTANAISDATIANYTHADPAKFPAAQKTFTLIISIALWIYVGMYAIFPAFAFVIINLLKKQIYNDIKKNKRSYFDSCTNLKKNSVRDFNLGFASFVGTVYTILILLGLISSIESKYVDRKMKEVLVFASFHLPPAACNIETSYSDSFIAFIGDDKFMTAVPDKELGYIFREEKCQIQPVSPAREKTQPIHRFRYNQNEFNSSRAITEKTCPARFCSIINGDFCI
ncbi:hypothetical protein [Pseudomonas fluorescens]|uniref:hypothetical protein n=1 Tax=Pseudomonas fluorescens TaxID=294 RepID=UPI0012407C4D|nr:hypothetical protein [Pseudomonas fluorescens]VVQ02508.1 hypothetical protein PS906_05146 [Pseudomonas fluorescens]